VEQVSLADSPSLTSSGLLALKERVATEEQPLAPRVVYEVGQAFSPQSDDEIPEEWRRERAFFEEHFEEILKPAPKIDLVGVKRGSSQKSSSVGAIAEWDDLSPAVPAYSRFGTLPSSNELLQLQAVPSPRRAITRSLVADPFDLLVYVGLPVMGVIIAIEVLIYVR
jgi:hypothetical protein